jgi:hypothetical protein
MPLGCPVGRGSQKKRSADGAQDGQQLLDAKKHKHNQTLPAPGAVKADRSEPPSTPGSGSKPSTPSTPEKVPRQSTDIRALPIHEVEETWAALPDAARVLCQDQFKALHKSLTAHLPTGGATNGIFHATGKKRFEPVADKLQKQLRGVLSTGSDAVAVEAILASDNTHPISRYLSLVGSSGEANRLVATRTIEKGEPFLEYAGIIYPARLDSSETTEGDCFGEIVLHPDSASPHLRVRRDASFAWQCPRAPGCKFGGSLDFCVVPAAQGQPLAQYANDPNFLLTGSLCDGLKVNATCVSFIVDGLPRWVFLADTRIQEGEEVFVSYGKTFWATFRRQEAMRLLAEKASKQRNAVLVLLFMRDIDERRDGAALPRELSFYRGVFARLAQSILKETPGFVAPACWIDEPKKRRRGRDMPLDVAWDNFAPVVTHALGHFEQYP